MARLQNFNLRSNDKKLEALLKERVQLKVRLQGLKAEVTEVHAQKETMRQQADAVMTQLRESQDLGNSLGVRGEAAATPSQADAELTDCLLLTADKAGVSASTAGKDAKRAPAEIGGELQPWQGAA